MSDPSSTLSGELRRVGEAIGSGKIIEPKAISILLLKLGELAAIQERELRILRELEAGGELRAGRAEQTAARLAQTTPHQQGNVFFHPTFGGKK